MEELECCSGEHVWSRYPSAAVVHPRVVFGGARMTREVGMSRVSWLFACVPLLAVAIFLPAPGIAKDTENAYVGLRKCAVCHRKEVYGDQVAAWRKGRHAKAFETLASERALVYAKERGIDGPPGEAAECVRCHVTAYGVEARLIKFELDPKDGVQCESCHAPGAKYRRRTVMSDHAKAMENGMACPLGRHLPQVQLCLKCHNEESPTWDPERYTLPDGSRTGFDYDQAAQRVLHRIPEERRGKISELEKAQRQKQKTLN
jgi:YD repeat-containing protein